MKKIEHLHFAFKHHGFGCRRARAGTVSTNIFSCSGQIQGEDFAGRFTASIKDGFAGSIKGRADHLHCGVGRS